MKIGRRLERRKPARRGDRSIPRTRLDKLFTDDRHGLRERVLWRMLCETAARAEELLSLNIEDLDLEFRRSATPRSAPSSRAQPTTADGRETSTTCRSSSSPTTPTGAGRNAAAARYARAASRPSGSSSARTPKGAERIAIGAPPGPDRPLSAAGRCGTGHPMGVAVLAINFAKDRAPRASPAARCGSNVSTISMISVDLTVSLLVPR